MWLIIYQIHPQLLAHGISYREFLRVPVVGTSYGVVLVAIQVIGRIVFRRRIIFPIETSWGYLTMQRKLSQVMSYANIEIVLSVKPSHVSNDGTYFHSSRVDMVKHGVSIHCKCDFGMLVHVLQLEELPLSTS